MVSVPVIKAFTHDGRAIRVGETITVAPILAAALSRRGVVSLTKGYRAADLQAESGGDERPRRRRRYRRKDLVAE